MLHPSDSSSLARKPQRVCSETWLVMQPTEASQLLRSIEVEPAAGDAPCQPQAAMR